MPKKTYSIEFKLQAVNLAQQDDMTISQAARDLGVSPSGLTKWVHQAASHQAVGRPVFTGRGIAVLSESERLPHVARRNALGRFAQRLSTRAFGQFAPKACATRPCFHSRYSRLVDKSGQPI